MAECSRAGRLRGVGVKAVVKYWESAFRVRADREGLVIPCEPE